MERGLLSVDERSAARDTPVAPDACTVLKT